MWGLSGLKTLNLSHNKLTNVIDQNFEGKQKLCKYIMIFGSISYKGLLSLTNQSFLS